MAIRNALLAIALAFSLGDVARASDIWKYLQARGVPSNLSAAETEKKLAALKGYPVDFDQASHIEVERYVTEYSRSLQPKRIIYSITERSIEAQFSEFAVPNSFIAFSSGSHIAEVMSWNRDLGEYEFFLMEFGKTRELQEFRRIPMQSCVGCHQHLGPILAGPPWVEFPEDSGVLNLDAHVRNSNDIVQAQRVCRDLHQKDPKFLELVFELRLRIEGRYRNFQDPKNLVAVSERIFLERLIPKDSGLQLKPFDQNGMTLSQAEELMQKEIATQGFDKILGEISQMTKATWPTEGYAFHSDVLADRDVTHPDQPILRLFDAAGRELTHTRYATDSRFIRPGVAHARTQAGPGGPTIDNFAALTERRESGKAAAEQGAPRTTRQKIQGIPHELFPHWLLNHLDACLGFYNSTEASRMIVRMKEKQEIPQILEQLRRSGMLSTTQREKKFPTPSEWSVFAATGQFQASDRAPARELKAPDRPLTLEAQCIRCHGPNDSIPFDLKDPAFKAEAADFLKRRVMPPSSQGRLTDQQILELLKEFESR